jgi:hypothetical protein
MESTAVSLEDCADALLLGGINETACIDQDHIGIVGLGGELIAVELGITEHDLGIDEIFGTAKADEADLAGFGSGGMGHRTGKAESWLLLVIQGMERTRESCFIIPQVLKNVAIRSA